MHEPSFDPLALDADEMRRIGYLTVDLLVGRILEDGPARQRTTAAELARRLGDPMRDDLAALDWGLGYGYARTAAVTARTPVGLAVLPDHSLDHAMQLSDGLDAAVRAALHERLPRR
ncbi:MAG: hypothetical protein ACRC50_03895 [Gaiella sp.]